MLFKLSAYRESYSRLLLAPENGCAGCTVRRREVAQTVLSDWDAASNSPLAGDVFTGDVNFEK